MPSVLILLLPLGLISAVAINWYLCFRRNIKKAKESGIPYVVVPAFVLHRFWLITHPLWLKIARKYLPTSWVDPWHDYSRPEFPWELRYEPFKRFGSDTFLAVSGGAFCLWTADADVISQITTRRNDFPKDIHIYTSIDIYGKNVVSTEGSEWRRHRKLTSPPFTEKNNHLVWTETLDQTQTMLHTWLGKDETGNRTIERIMDDTMRLSLHVISRAGFGRKMEWPQGEAAVQSTEPSKILNEKAEIGQGHTMSFTYALHALLDNILFIFLFKPWILRLSPWKIMRHSYVAYVEWGNHMREMVASKKAAIQSGQGMDEMDIMGQLVKGQVLAPDEKTSSKDTPLSDPEILGNAFVLILAGHETAANSIHFSILLLALNIGSQRRLQKDLDEHFQGRPVSEWDYDRDLPTLFGGMTGAVMNEQLRIACPVVAIPKCTYGVPDQPLMVNGKKCTLPTNSFINLCAASVHANPNCWPHGPPRDPNKPAHPFSNLDNDLEEFKPERWLLDSKQPSNPQTNDSFTDNKEGKLTSADPSEDLGINTAPDTSNSLYRPPRGAFIPFSEGFRACLGRRFAQVEVLAALAAIFSQYSVELAVDRYATDAEVDKMDQKERRQVWEKAAQEATRLIRGSTSMITLQMRDGHVPVRLVRRGEERFDFDT
jgi:cytochrome P450